MKKLTLRVLFVLSVLLFLSALITSISYASSIDSDQYQPFPGCPGTPTHTSTTAPTNTPEDTATPEPTSTPVDTDTPEPSSTPVDTATATMVVETPVQQPTIPPPTPTTDPGPTPTTDPGPTPTTDPGPTPTTDPGPAPTEVRVVIPPTGGGMGIGGLQVLVGILALISICFFILQKEKSN